MANDPTTPEVILLRLPSRLELLVVLDRVTLALCERMGFDEDTSSQMSMAVIEAGTNAVQHGSANNPAGLYDVRFELHADRMEITVHDSGKGFD